MVTIILIPAAFVCSVFMVKVILNIRYYNTVAENHQVNTTVFIVFIYEVVFGKRLMLPAYY